VSPALSHIAIYTLALERCADTAPAQPEVGHARRSHARVHVHPHTHAHEAHSLSLSHAHTAHPHSLSRTHTQHTHSLSLARTHSLSHAHTPPRCAQPCTRAWRSSLLRPCPSGQRPCMHVCLFVCLFVVCSCCLLCCLLLLSALVVCSCCLLLSAVVVCSCCLLHQSIRDSTAPHQSPIRAPSDTQVPAASVPISGGAWTWCALAYATGRRLFRPRHGSWSAGAVLAGTGGLTEPQRSAAQHSTAQHSAAQRSTAQHLATSYTCTPTSDVERRYNATFVARGYRMAGRGRSVAREARRDFAQEVRKSADFCPFRSVATQIAPERPCGAVSA
jgi:hypothetical protein